MSGYGSIAGSTLLVACASLAWAGEAAAPAEPAGRSWTVLRAGSEIGHEVVSESSHEGRRLLISEGEMTLVATVRFEQRTEVDAASQACLAYRMEASVAGSEQVIEAVGTDSGIRFRVQAGGREIEQEGSGRAPLLCLDNLVFAHFDALGRAALAHGDERLELTLAVAQVMRAIPATFESGKTVSAVIGDGARPVREGRLTAVGLLTRVWFDAEDGRAYRVEIPAQQLEARVEGWKGLVEPTDEPAAAGPQPEIDVAFDSPLGRVPGTLTLPAAGAGPFPGVILLHGSGPHDRDETIGPNKPFRDLAHGLAREGLATLRFDKRTWLMQRERERALEADDDEALAKLERDGMSLTLREEAIMDGIAALRYLADRPEVRDDALFIAGHSLGALAAPEVADAVEGSRGVVLLAGPGRPLDVIMKEQVAFQSRLAGLTEEQASARVSEEFAALERLREAGFPDGGSFMGASARYWKDLLRRDAPAELARFRLPVLLLRGGKDIQVTAADFENARQALASREGVPFSARVFDDLNHLFIATEKSTGAEYYEPGRLAPEVVATIAAWIHALARAAPVE